MTDDLMDVVARELRARAATVEAAPDTTDVIVRRGRIARRRRRAMAGALSAAVAVAGVSAGVTFLPKVLEQPDGQDVAATPTSASPTSPRSDVDLSYAPQVYVEPPSNPGGSSVIHAGRASVSLPAGWVVNRLITTKTGAVADVQDMDDRFAAFVDHASGTSARLSGIHPPLAVSGNGETVVGTLSGEGAGRGLVALALPGGQVTASRGDVEGATPVLVRDDGTVVVTQDDLDPLGGIPARSLLWNPATGSLVAIDGLASGERVVDVLGDGGFLTRSASGEQLAAAVPGSSGSRRWTTPVDGAAQLSPGGQRVALRADDRLHFVDATTGEQTAVSDPVPVTPRQLTWEDEETVLVLDPAMTGVTIVRCSASSGACAEVTTPGRGAYLVAEHP